MQWMNLLGSGARPVLALLLAGVSNGGQDPVDPGPQETAPETSPVESPAPEPPARPASAYRFLGDREGLLSSWLGSGLAEPVALGTSAGGRDIFCVQFGAPGPLPLAERTTVLLLGGLDGISLSGSEAVLQITSTLLADPEGLPADATFVAIPWSNPDGLARRLATGCSDGRNDRALDDDRDGAVDEDLPDDLDGDGLVLEMLLEDPLGPWVRAEGGRFLRPARDGEAPRYLRVCEGRDDDGDGRYNEDPAGGVVLDRNFPVHWEGPWTGALSGPWPLSEPASRAIAEFALARRTALALLFQGNHGQLATPGGVPERAGVLALPFASDGPAHRTVLEVFLRRTGRAQSGVRTLAEAYGEPRSGAAVDWFYAACCALAFEVGVWGPGVSGSRTEMLEGQFERRPDGAGASDGSAQRQDARPLGSNVDLAWARWLDETRGGLGFMDWQPIDVGNGRQALVGGWEPYTCLNPPADVLSEATAGLDGFVRELARGLPRFELEVEEKSRDGIVCILKVRARNSGALPTGVGPAGPGAGARLTLVPPPGVTLLSGERSIELEHLPGQGRSASQGWLIVAPEDTLFELVIESPWTPPLRKEVRL